MRRVQATRTLSYVSYVMFEKMIHGILQSNHDMI